MSAAVSIAPAPLSETRIRTVPPISHRRALAEFDYLVPRIARPLVGGGADLDDLVQEGRLGLLIAADHWREDHPAAFPAFATVCIRNAVRAAAKRARARARWNETASMDDAGDDVAPLHEVIGAPAGQEHAADLARVRQIVSQLSDRDREILDAHAAGCTFEEIGRRLNLTGCRVRQIVSHALAAVNGEPTAAKAPPTARRGTKPRRYLTHADGRSMTKAQWARVAGIGFMTLSRRLAEGWTLEAAVSTPTVMGRPARSGKRLR